MEEETSDPGLAVRYFRSTSIGWIRIILVRGIQFFYIFLMARWLLPDEMGYLQIFAVGLSFLGFVITPWIGWTMQQKALAETDPEKASTVIHQHIVYGIIVCIIFTPIAAVAYLLTTPVILHSPDAFIFIITVFVLSLYQLILFTYPARLKVEYHIFFGALQTILNLILPLIFYFLTLNITTILVGWLLADLIVLLLIIPKSGLKMSLASYKFLTPSKVLIIFAIPVFFFYLFQGLRNFINRYLVLLVFSLADFASYHLVTRITGIAQEAILVLLLSFLPIMTKLIETRSERKTIALKASFNMISLVVLFIAPILYFCGFPIIELILGPQYATIENQIILGLATITMVFFVYSSICLKVTGAKGETYKLLAFNFSFVGGFALIMMIFFLLGWISFLGLYGIALAMTLGYLIALLIIVGFTKDFRLIGPGPVIRIVALGLIQVIVVFLLSLWFVPIDLIELFLITGISFLSLLLLSALFSVFSSEELDIISRISKNRLDLILSVYRRLGLQKRIIKSKDAPKNRDSIDRKNKGEITK